MDSNDFNLLKQSILSEIKVMMQATGQVTQYIGARYVPLFADPLEWSDAMEYEPLTVVLHQGNSFTSRQFVPQGIDISDETFWANTGNYNAQIDQYRQEVESYKNEVDKFFKMSVKTFTSVDVMKNGTLNLNDLVVCHKYNTVNDYPVAFIISGEKGHGAIPLKNNLYAVPYYENFVSPANFGGYGDGIHDDYDAIVKCLSANTDIYSNLQWATSSPVVYNGNNNILQLKIKALNPDFDSPVVSIETSTYGKTYNIETDANGNGTGISTNCTLCHIFANSNNASAESVKHERGYGNHFWITARNTQQILSNCTGLNMKGTDNIIDFIETVNIKHGVTNNAGFNKYIMVHPWIYGRDTLYIDSVAFEAYASCSIETLYSDTMNYGLLYNGNIDMSIGEFRTFFNDEAISDSIANNNPPKLVKSTTTFRADATHFININNLHGYSYKTNKVNILKEEDYPDYMLQHFIVDNMVGLTYKGSIRNAPYGVFGAENINVFSDLNLEKVTGFDEFLMVEKKYCDFKFVQNDQYFTTVNFSTLRTTKNAQKIAVLTYMAQLKWDTVMTYIPVEITTNA